MERKSSGNDAEITIDETGQDVHYIGEMYDNSTKSFTSVKLLKSSLPKDFITVTETYKHDCIDNGIGVEESGSVSSSRSGDSPFSNQIMPRGIWELMPSRSNGSDSRNRTVDKNYELKVSTKSEKLNRACTEVWPHLDMTALDKGTHVVTGIQWGGSLKMQYIANLSNNTRETRKEAESFGERLWSGVAAFFGGKPTGEIVVSGDMQAEWNVRIIADGLIDMQLKTAEDVLAYSKDFPTAIRRMNNGKGVPVKYTLTPVQVYKDYAKWKIQERVMVAILFVVLAIILRILI